MEQIRYFAPLERSLDQMRALLFRPFALRRWLLFALAAWLADLPGGSQGRILEQLHGGTSDAVAAPLVGLTGVLPALGSGTSWGTLIGGISAIFITLLVLAGIVLAVVLLWVNSRAKFVWIENVWHGECAIREPWRRFQRQGNSFFWWRLGLGLLFLVAIGMLVVGVELSGLAAGFGGGGLGDSSLFPLVGLVLAALPLGVVAAYCLFWVEAFVLPLMIRHNTDFVGGLRHFWELLRQHPGSFLMVGLMALGIKICAALVVLVLIVVSLGIGLLLLILPFVGTLCLLPVVMTVRAYPLQWLAHFDPAFALTAPTEPV